MTRRDLDKAAQCGEPSYVWRAGQERRLELILSAAQRQLSGRMLDNDCGIGQYLQHLAQHASAAVGLEFELERLREARQHSSLLVNAAAEALPFANLSFHAILSHEVLEHVSDDRLSMQEMVRVLSPGGVILLFVPNRGYPFETHGIYWRGKYHFGNIPLVNYLPSRLRRKLAPHVRAYAVADLEQLVAGLPVRVTRRAILYGAYDNLIQRFPNAGRVLRRVLHWLEGTPLKIFGLSHFWVIEKI